MSQKQLNSLMDVVHKSLRDDIFRDTDSLNEEEYRRLYVDDRDSEESPFVEYSVALAAHRLVVLVGGAGVGKTTFLLHYHLVAQEYCHRFWRVPHIVDTFVEGVSRQRWFLYADLKSSSKISGVSEYCWSAWWSQLRGLVSATRGDDFLTKHSTEILGLHYRLLGLGDIVREMGEEERRREMARLVESPAFCLRVVLRWLSQRSDAPLITLVLDNGDLQSKNIELDLFTFAAQLANVGHDVPEELSLEFTNLVVVLRPETWTRLGATYEVDWGAGCVSISAPSRAKLILARAEALRKRIEQVGLELEQVRSATSMGGPSFPVKNFVPISVTAEIMYHLVLLDYRHLIPDLSRQIVSETSAEIFAGLVGNSTRRLLHATRNVCSNIGVQRMAIAKASTGDSSFGDGDVNRNGVSESLAISTYTFIDALICGPKRRLSKGDGSSIGIVVNVFNLRDQDEICETSELLVGPIALQLVTGMGQQFEKSELVGKLVECGFTQEVSDRTVTRLVENRLLLGVGSANDPDAFVRVETSFVNAHLELLGEAAYLDNVAQTVRTASLRPCDTVGYEDSDFSNRISTTVAFIGLLRESERSFVISAASQSKLFRVSLWSVWCRAVAGYRRRLMGLRESKQIPPSSSVAEIDRLLSSSALVAWASVGGKLLGVEGFGNNQLLKGLRTVPLGRMREYFEAVVE